MNRGQQQPQPRPQNLPPAPGMAQFNRQLYPTNYPNVPPRNTIPQSYPTLQQHRPQSILPQTPGFMQRGGAGYFGPTQVLGNTGLQPSPNPPHPSLQSSQNSVQQQLQQPQQQHQQPPGTSNGLSQHLSAPGSGQSGTGTPANANSTANTTSDSALDPNEFPALGSGAGMQPNAGSASASGNVHTSYASQAGTAISSGPGSIASSVNGPTPGLRDFRPEDFPALGGPASTAQSQQLGQNSQGQQDVQSEPNQGQQSGIGGMQLSGQSVLPPGITPGQGQSRQGNFLKMGQSNLWSQPQPNNSFQPHLTNGLSQSNHGLPPGVPIPSSFNGQPPQGLSQMHQGSQSDASSVLLATPTSSQPGHQSQTSSQTSLPQTPAQQVLLSAADRWGLLSLLASIKGSDPDGQLLAIGTDLSGLGLDMNTSGNLYSMFVTPWSDSTAALSIEPEFHLPACYNVSTPAPGPAKAASFSDETLFFMFYSSPRDTLQEIAAQELHNRNWRFHKEARLWLTKESGQTPFQKGATFERGTYTFFDPEAWEKTKREATIYYEQLEDRSTVPPPITGANLNSVPPQMGMNSVGIPGMAPMGLQSAPGVNMQQQPLGMRG